MAKRDPLKTARNRKVAELKSARRDMLQGVLDSTQIDSEASLNALIGHNYQRYCDVKSSQYTTFEEFFNQFITGLRSEVLSRSVPDRFELSPYKLAKKYQNNDIFRRYMDNFLESSFLKHYDEYSRPKPHLDTEFWLGEKNAEYGLFVTPRYNAAINEWENDKSEIRKAKFDYYTIGHIVTTGLCVPGKNSRITFGEVGDYLKFFSDVIVRGAGSVHQNNLADRYVRFVNESDNPNQIPLLLPELRYLGKSKKHKYRLDFSVINPHTFQIVGFELSPWSSHGYLSGTKTKKVKEVNDEALANFEKECEKTRKHFIDKGIPIVTYTDSMLAEPDSIFQDVKKYLVPAQQQKQLLLIAKDVLLDTDFDAEILDQE